MDSEKVDSSQSGADETADEHTQSPAARLARKLYLDEPAFDQDEGLSKQDKIIADSFPASDPPQMP